MTRFAATFTLTRRRWLAAFGAAAASLPARQWLQPIFLS